MVITVDDEHSRMEYNDENVYHEQSIMGTNDTEETPKTAGPMKLDEVLVEWERMKQDNAKKHQEEIKKRVLTQTGKIFADFDNSIKSGILGELAREEEEAQRKDQISSARKGNNGFLDADVTGDILQQVSDEEFDTAYAADHKQLKKVQESDKAEEPEQTIDSNPDLPEAESEPYTQAAGDDETDRDTQDIPAKNITDSKPDAYSEETDQAAAVAEDEAADVSDQEIFEAASAADSDVDEQNLQEETEQTDEKEEVYTQKIPVEGVGECDAEKLPDLSDTEEIYAEKTEAYTEDADAESADAYIEETYEAGENTTETDTEDSGREAAKELYAEGVGEYTGAVYAEGDRAYHKDAYAENDGEYTGEIYADDAGEYTEEIFVEDTDTSYTEESYTEELYTEDSYIEESYAEDSYMEDSYTDESYNDFEDENRRPSADSRYTDRRRNMQYSEDELDPEDAESIAEMAKEDALKTQEIKMNTADLSSLSEKIVATTKKEASGAKREEIRDFTPDEQTLFENFAVTKKIKKQIIYALENMTLSAYTGNVIITGDAGLDTVRMAKNLIKEYQASDESFSGKLAKITGEKINQRNIKDVFEKLYNGGIIIEKANGMSEEKLYELATNLNQDTLGIVVIMEDTKKEITKLLEKQAMIVDYFNIRIDLMEMDNNALVAYAKNYALALEYSIDELGTLALYTRIANMQSGNHVVTKDEVRDIIDEAIWKSKKSKIKNFVDVLFARRYDNEDMIVLKERDFM